jgi:hypothetical protein
MSYLPHVDSARRSRPPHRRRGPLAAAMSFVLAVVALFTFTLAGAGPASADFVNPDRRAFPIIAGTRVEFPAGNNFCTVGAVLVSTSLLSRLRPYDRAVRYLVTAKHCAPLYANVKMGPLSIGSVVWQSAASDIELIRVSPSQDPDSLSCIAHHKLPAWCSPTHTYTPRAEGRVFALSQGHVARMPVTGSATAQGRFCTSGYVTGVKCVYQPIDIPRDTPVRYQHLVAGESDESDNTAAGDSGGPVLNYARELLGIISGRTLDAHSHLIYTPMTQVLQELHGYRLAPVS